MPHEQDASEPGLNKLENELSSLRLSPSRLNRDDLMFRAGQARSRSSMRWPWPSTSAVLALVVMVQAIALSRPHEPLFVIREALPSLPTPSAASQQQPPATLANHSAALPLQNPWRVVRGANWLLAAGPHLDLDNLPEPPPLPGGPDSRSSLTALDSSRVLLRSELARLMNPGETL